MAAGGARRNARYTPLEVTGPLPWQMLRDTPAIRSDPLGYLERTVATHGDLVAFPLPRTPVLLVNDPAGARRVLQENHRGYSKQTVQYAALSAVTGAGLLTSDGEDWRRHRRVAQPAFHHERLLPLAGHAVAAAGRLLQAWRAAPAADLDVDAALQRTGLDLVATALFGQPDAGALAGSGQDVLDAVSVALAEVVRAARTPLPAAVPTPARLRLKRARSRLDGACAALVAQRRELAAGAGRSEDLLDLLLAGLDQREVRDELVTFVIAGGETVASCLTWALWLLAGAPAEQAAVHAELDAVLAGRPPGWADLPRLPVLRAVVEEALRLYPPAWVITRRALRPDRVAGVDVPAGTLLLLSPWLLHRRSAAWPEPERFRPDRFAGAARADSVAAGYLPFGAGPRLCIGREVALTEAVLVLATVLREAAVRRSHPGRPEVDALVTLRPRGGLRLRLAER